VAKPQISETTIRAAAAIESRVGCEHWSFEFILDSDIRISDFLDTQTINLSKDVETYAPFSPSF